MTLKQPERDVLIAHNRKKAQEAIEEVTWFIENQKWHLAMNRIYYGKTETIERKYGRWLYQAYENRMESDYNVLAEFTEETVRQAFANMQAVIAEIEGLFDEPNEEEQP